MRTHVSGQYESEKTLSPSASPRYIGGKHWATSASKASQASIASSIGAVVAFVTSLPDWLWLLYAVPPVAWERARELGRALRFAGWLIVIVLVLAIVYRLVSNLPELLGLLLPLLTQPVVAFLS